VYDELDFDQVKLTPYKIPNLKPLLNMPRTRINFELDEEERQLLSKKDILTREELWDLLEKKRFEDLERKTKQMQGAVIANGRCPKCTLVPPCQHYKDHKQILADAERLLYQEEYKQAIAPAKREKIVTSLKKHSLQNPSVAGSSRLNSPTFQTRGASVDSHSNLPVSRGADFSRRHYSIEPHDYIKRGEGYGGSPTRFEL
jgi:hypothetical protein